MSIRQMKLFPAAIFCMALALGMAWLSPVGAASDFAELRREIMAANRDGTGSITLSGDITLSEPLPSLTGAITIAGNGHTISGDSRFRIFDLAGGALTITDATLMGGYADKNGGAIRMQNEAQLMANDVAFVDNQAEWGGAIATVNFSGSLEIAGSLFTGNTAGTGGGAILFNGGALELNSSHFASNKAGSWGGAIETLSGQANLANSTFADNAAGSGGGILVSGAMTTMTHLTLVDNRALWGEGAGIFKRAGLAQLRNSIVAGDGSGLGCAGGLDESIGNISDDGSCALLPGGDLMLGDITGAPAHIPLLDGSPAVDGGADDFCLETDQISTARPQGAGCDAGAIEAISAQPPEPLPPPMACGLRDQILAANTNMAVGACPAGTSHDIIVLNEDITLTEPLPAFNGTITIEGNGHTISGDWRFRIFDVIGKTLTIKNLTLRDGYSERNGGAIRLQQGAKLIADDVVFVENQAEWGGAIATVNFRGSLEITRSVFEDNYAGTGGGAILLNGGALKVDRSHFASNKAGSWGGAIETLSGRANLANSTFADNAAGSAGGILVSGATTTMTHLTLLDNRALWGEGAGIYKRAGLAQLRNSIVAGDGGGLGCAGGLNQSRGNFSDDGSCGSAVAGDPLLGEMKGDVGYFPPLKGSPVVDAADAAFCLDADQRGVARPVGAGCDIGAIESGGEAVLAAPLVVASGQAQADCQVTTTHSLNFRDGPGGAIIGGVMAQTTLPALDRNADWFQVDYSGVIGWISAGYVVTSGNCG